MQPIWFHKIHSAASSIADGEDIAEVFDTLLRLIWVRNWEGACHDTSAALYMIFSELNLDPQLVIGEVMTPAGRYFDHSWVEVDGKIFDAAVSLPLREGADAGPPVFASLDIDTLNPTVLQYGVRSHEGLVTHGLDIAHKTLEEYSQMQGFGATIWDITPIIADLSGFSLDAEYLRREYGHLKREIRGQDL